MHNEVQPHKSAASGIANAAISRMKPHHLCACGRAGGIAVSGGLTHGCPSVTLRH